MAFATRVMTREFGKGNQVCHNSVDCTPWEVAQTLVLSGLADPCKANRAGQQQLDLQLHCLLQHYKNKDQPPEL
eukprot:4860473-Ditylum_brightwellii.AAC.1